MTVNKRLLFGSLGIAVVASLVIGYAISDRSTSATTSDDDVSLSSGDGFDSPIATNAAVEGVRLADVNVYTRDGDAIATSDLLGKPMVVNVWYASCQPCRKELPAFAAAHRQFGEQVRFVGIDTLAPSDFEEDFAISRGVRYELYYDTDGAFAVAMGVTAPPITLFVRPDGTIVEQTGQLDAARLNSIITTELL